MNIKAFIIFFLGFLFLIGAVGQEKTAPPPVPLFQSDELLYLELRADYKNIFPVTDDSTYFPARLSVADNDGQVITMDVQIRTRGKTRRKMGVCSFTPLRVNFPKKETNNTPFEGQGAIKLVTHCNKASHFEQNIILEYLIYKAFNVLTDSSLKVRPAIINYIYDDRKGETIERFAFFIERDKHMADRLHMVERKPDRIGPDRLDSYQTCLVDIFQYMIGNTDYSIYERHNVVILSDAFGTGQPVAVPYDFDWSGVVSANYAVPNPKINTKDVTVRVFRGVKQEEEILHHIIDRFKAKKEEIYSVFEDFELLDQKEKKRVTRYLDVFYRVIENDRLARMEFVEKARNFEF